MKKQIIFLVLLFIQAVLCAQPRFDSSVFKPIKPKTTEHIQVVYDAQGRDLEFSDAIQAVFFLYEDFEWKKFSLLLKKNKEGLWSSMVPVKPTTAFIGVKFYQGDSDRPDVIDNNQDRGYAIALTDAKGKAVPGAYLGEASFQIPAIAGGGIFSYYSTPPPPMPTNYAKALAEKEFALSGKQYLRYFQAFMNLQKLALGEAFPDYAKKLITDELKQKKISDQVLNQFYSYASTGLQDKELAQLIKKRVHIDFPQGETARFIAYSNTMVSSLNKVELIASYENFLRLFPVQQWRQHPSSQAFIYYAVYRGLGSAYFESKQFDKFAKLYDEVDFRTGNELMRWNIMRAYMFKTVGADSLYQLSEIILPKLIARKRDNSYKEDFNRMTQADSNVVKNLDDRLFTHISLLNDLKKYSEARRYFLLLSEDGKYSRAELNDINLQVLEGMGDDKQILPLLEMSARCNAMTPRMLDKLKKIYLKGHSGDESGYQAYLTGLKSSEEQAIMRAYVDHNWVNYPMPAFRLETADGFYITAQDWKDKIVVVDFWATWCRPCIMAFPGMQLLVDKYAQDTHVAIYMLGTMQTGNYKDKSVNYVRSEGFRFNLLHDSVNPKTNEQDLLFRQLVPLFGDSSIPRKIIVKDGRIRYCSGGYSGSPSKLMDELSLAIDLLRKEK